MSVPQYIKDAVAKANTQTQFRGLSKGGLYVEHGAVIWAHLDGIPYGKFNKTDRTFSLVVSDSFAEYLNDNSWKVTDVTYDDDGEPFVVHTVTVKVNFREDSPIDMITRIDNFMGQRPGTYLTEDDTKALTRLQKESFDDVTLLLNRWRKKDTNDLFTAYLNKGWFEVTPEDAIIRSKYADVSFGTGFISDSVRGVNNGEPEDESELPF